MEKIEEGNIIIFFQLCLPVTLALLEKKKKYKVKKKKNKREAKDS